MSKFIILFFIVFSSVCTAQVGNNDRTVKADEIEANSAGQVTFLSPLRLNTLTANTVPYLDANKDFVSSLITPTELGYLSGTTSAIQTQLNGKVETSDNNTWTGTNDFQARLTATGTDFSNVPCPKMTEAQRDALVSPASGDCVFNTTENQLNIYNGTEWAAAGGDGGGSIGLSELLVDPSFEDEVDESSCTNASVSFVASTLHGTKAARVTCSADGGYCDFVKSVPSDRQGQLHQVSVWAKTSAANGIFILRNNSTSPEQRNIDSDGTWTRYTATANANTNLGYRIQCNNTETVDLDDAEITSDVDIVESYFQKQVDISLVGANNFTAGTIRVARNGDIVSIKALSTLEHNNNSAPTTGDILPDWAYGTVSDAKTVFNFPDDTSIARVSITTTGNLQFRYLDSSFSLTTRTNTGSGLTISYPVNDQYSGNTSYAAQELMFPVPVTKTLSADVENTTGDLTDLTFNDLKPNTWYTVVLNVNMISAKATTVSRAQLVINPTYDGSVLVPWKSDIEGTVRGSYANSVSRTFKTTDATSVTFNVLVANESIILGDGTTNETFAQLIEHPRSLTGLFDLQGILKISGEGSKRYESGWASFGGVSSAVSCTTGTCGKFEVEGSVGGNMSLVFDSTGVYDFTSSGWAAGASVVCNPEPSLDRVCNIPPADLVANGSGVVTSSMNCYSVTAAALTNAAIKIKCEGQVP